MPTQATTDQSGGIKRPIEANSEMGTGAGDVDTDVPMLVIDQRPSDGGRRVLTERSGLDSEFSAEVLCSISEEAEAYEEQEEDSGKEMNLVPERWVCDCKTGIEISPCEGTQRSQGRNQGDDEPSWLRRGCREEAHPCKVAERRQRREST